MQLGGTDLRSQLVPIGQDGFLARGLAKRFRTVGGVVQAVQHSVVASIESARRLDPLAPDSVLARELGTRYPIAQGPMTRVSDRPAFAAAVAEDGGLPFLALALLRADEVRRVLRETADLIPDRPWGAGILGFVPPELREEQMGVLLESPPPVALIAGGRPSQARRLEEKGTLVYLHVPSPGLLDRFLADGARRFVFEGRECGGHVGPRTSFTLWEAQLERLLAFDRPEELRVLFAGGIHDARSAAMVAAMAAPLVERGASIGVLMGTAYLTTAEAVDSRAIQPGFQDAALEADRTVLLETSPGHATRCVDTEYVRTFADERRRLTESGASSQELWAALELLNLGRLRIASKGLRRDGDELGTVEADVQRKEGMYMMGQVAALRSDRTTVADLHSDVSEGAAAVLADAVDRLGTSEPDFELDLEGDAKDGSALLDAIGSSVASRGDPVASHGDPVASHGDPVAVAVTRPGRPPGRPGRTWRRAGRPGRPDQRSRKPDRHHRDGWDLPRRGRDRPVLGQCHLRYELDHRGAA